MRNDLSAPQRRGGRRALLTTFGVFGGGISGWIEASTPPMKHHPYLEWSSLLLHAMVFGVLGYFAVERGRRPTWAIGAAIGGFVYGFPYAVAEALVGNYIWAGGAVLRPALTLGLVFYYGWPLIQRGREE